MVFRKHQHPPDPPGKENSSDLGKSTPVDKDLLQVILEFISKCLYPAIITAILVMAYPAIEKIDLAGLVKRLSSAKGAGYEFTFVEAESIGADKAILNGKISNLERTQSALKADLEVFRAKFGTPQLTTAEKTAEKAEEEKIKRNSSFTVLVFYVQNRQAEAERITTLLLKNGYKSSGTETNFAELQQTHPEETVYVNHNSDGTAALADTTRLLESLGLARRLKVKQEAVTLRRGQIQVLLF